MARMTVRLPESLHQALAERAEAEGVSMNQFVVYALTQVTAADSVRQQLEQFEALKNAVPKAQAEADLAELLAARG